MLQILKPSPHTLVSLQARSEDHTTLPLWPSDPGQSRLLNTQLRAPSLPRQAVSLSLVSEEEEACLPELPLQVTGVQEPPPHEGRATWAKTKTRWWSLHRDPEDLTTGTCFPSQGKQSVICSGNHISLCQAPKPTPGLPVSRRCRVQGLPASWGLSCVLPPSQEEASCLGAPFKTFQLPTTARGNLKPGASPSPWSHAPLDNSPQSAPLSRPQGTDGGREEGGKGSLLPPSRFWKATKCVGWGVGWVGKYREKGV